jgi:hypothetical protein
LPARKIAGALTSLTDLRRKAKLPADIDRRLGDSLSKIKQLPQMPMRERKEEARKQQVELSDIGVSIGHLLSSMPGPDVGSGLGPLIDALGAVAEGTGDAAGSILEGIGSIDISV